MSDDLLRLFDELDDEPVSRESYLRITFGYPGSKARSLEYILPRLPYRKKYIEVFGGSAAVLMARKPSDLEVYNDRYGGIVAFYRCLKDREKLTQLTAWLETSLHSREEFIWCASTWENCEDDVERAARWYYMLRMSFSGLGRNFGRATSGKSNSGSKLANSLKEFEPMHQRLLNVQIENLDWKQCIRDYDSKDAVFYLDPPYYGTDAGIYKHKFTENDHKELCNTIFECQGFVALSGYENPIYDKYNWDNRIDWEVHSTMKAMAFTDTNFRNSNDRHRPVPKEILWIKEAK